MIWLDAHLSPRMAEWLQETLGCEAIALRDLGLRDADDHEIFSKAKEANIIILTKDKDFAEMVIRHGSPPNVIWLRCGNTSESRLKELLSLYLSDALGFIHSGECLVEIR
jgi:predicted nuclease of predicted toxin-antitoxin system